MKKPSTYLARGNAKIDVAKAYQMKYQNNMGVTDIARYFNVSKQSVQQALKRFRDVLLPQDQLQVYQENKDRILESVESKLLVDLVDVKKRKAASLNNTAYALSQVANMTRLEKGLSTSNVAYVDMTSSLEELKAQRAQLQEALDGLL
jgi:predicted DNA-binding protein YlxM (UPF0122 family)